MNVFSLIIIYTILDFLGNYYNLFYAKNVKYHNDLQVKKLLQYFLSKKTINYKY